MSLPAFANAITAAGEVDAFPADFPYFMRHSKQTIWQEPSASSADIARLLFREPDSVYSFWEITCPSDMVFAAASFEATATEPYKRTKTYFSVAASDWYSIETLKEQVDENDCHAARGLHWNVNLRNDQAIAIVERSRVRGLIKIQAAKLKAINRLLLENSCRLGIGSELNRALSKCSCEAQSG